MEEISRKDLLNLSDDTFVKSILGPDEQIFLSCLISKYNRYGFKQERTLLITNIHIFNIHKKSILFPLITLLEINRKIEIGRVDGVTQSSQSDSFEFIIHVKNEYDYRYASNQYRDKIIEIIKRIAKVKGNKVLVYQVPQSKLKQHATLKGEGRKGMQRRPEKQYIMWDEEEEKIEEQVKQKLSIKEPKKELNQEEKAEVQEQQQEVKQEAQEEEEKNSQAQTIIKEQQIEVVEEQNQNQPQIHTKVTTEIELQKPQLKKTPIESHIVKEDIVIQQPQIISPPKEVVEIPQGPKSFTFIKEEQLVMIPESDSRFSNQIYLNIRCGVYNDDLVMVSELPPNSNLTVKQIDSLNECEHSCKVVCVVGNEGEIKKMVFEDVAESITLTTILEESANAAQQPQRVFDTKLLTKLYSPIVRAIGELQDKGINIYRIQPENILVKGMNSENPQVRILMSGMPVSTKQSFTAHQNAYQNTQLTVQELKYQAPEFLEKKDKSITSNFWAVGIMMYEHAYGLHPFANKDPKIMQALIRRYPVVFPECTCLTQEYMDLLRDLLNKDYSQRLGSEEGSKEILSHSFFQSQETSNLASAQ